MSNFIFMLGVGVLCKSISIKFQLDLIGVLCVIGASVDLWSYLFWRK
jgi:hypothetical protein